MSLLSTVIAGALIAGPAPPAMGSIYGKVVAKASYFVTKPSAQNGYARRTTSPAQLMREPSGIIVSLSGAALDKEKFDPPTDEVKIVWRAMGLEPRLVGCMIGSPLSIENTGDKPLKLTGAAFVKDAIPPKEAKKIVLEETGVYELQDSEQPGSKVIVVVTQNPFVIALDETGEFLFEDLVPGEYTLRVFARAANREMPVIVKPEEREQVTIVLPPPKKETP